MHNWMGSRMKFKLIDCNLLNIFSYKFDASTFINIYNKVDLELIS